mgnify:CR=1 FL=1
MVDAIDQAVKAKQAALDAVKHQTNYVKHELERDYKHEIEINIKKSLVMDIELNSVDERFLNIKGMTLPNQNVISKEGGMFDITIRLPMNFSSLDARGDFNETIDDVFCVIIQDKSYIKDIERRKLTSNRGTITARTRSVVPIRSNEYMKYKLNLKKKMNALTK